MTGLSSIGAAELRTAGAWRVRPDWVKALAIACDVSSQSAVARQLGYSPAVVSTVLANKYQGDLTAVEQAVRGALMAQTILCPVVGELSSQACNAHQRQPWAPHNPQRIQFYKACRAGCPHSRLNREQNP